LLNPEYFGFGSTSGLSHGDPSERQLYATLPLMEYGLAAHIFLAFEVIQGLAFYSIDGGFVGYMLPLYPLYLYLYDDDV
jgi:hypothetical protein